MNREETKQAISVLQAYVDGAEIECKDRRSQQGFENRWDQCTPCEYLIWNFETHEYRIKPKPREFWITESGIGNATAHRIEQAAIDWSISKDSEIIKVREVIDD